MAGWKSPTVGVSLLLAVSAVSLAALAVTLAALAAAKLQAGARMLVVAGFHDGACEPVTQIESISRA